MRAARESSKNKGLRAVDGRCVAAAESTVLLGEAVLATESSRLSSGKKIHGRACSSCGRPLNYGGGDIKTFT